MDVKTGEPQHQQQHHGVTKTSFRETKKCLECQTSTKSNPSTGIFYDYCDGCRCHTDRRCGHDDCQPLQTNRFFTSVHYIMRSGCNRLAMNNPKAKGGRSKHGLRCEDCHHQEKQRQKKYKMKYRQARMDQRDEQEDEEEEIELEDQVHMETAKDVENQQMKQAIENIEKKQRTIVITNILGVEEVEIRKTFECIGKVESILFKDNWCYIQYDSQDHATQAIDMFNNIPMFSHVCLCIFQAYPFI